MMHTQPTIDPLTILGQYFPLAPEEKLLSQGCYHYFCNGQLMTVVEPWLMTELDQTTVIRSMREASAYNTQIYVMAKKRFASFEAQIIYKQGAFRKEVFYSLEKSRLTMRDKADDSQLTMQLRNDATFFPLLRIFIGDVLYAAHQKPTDVLVPLIAEGTNLKQILSPTISQRQSRFLTEEHLSIDDKEFIAQKWSYQGDRYGAGTHFWLDQKRVMLAYEWPQSADANWKVLLRNYQCDLQQAATNKEIANKEGVPA